MIESLANVLVTSQEDKETIQMAIDHICTLEADRKNLQDRIRELEAIVEKLPLTADGVRVLPLDKVWANVPCFGSPVECEVGNPSDSAWYEWYDDDVRGPDPAWISVSNCYSTPEAAKAAKVQD